MEIFETIWTALTTENEVLMNLIFIPEVFLEIFINMLLFTTLLKISANKTTKIKYVIILSTIVNISTIIIPNPYCSCLNLIALFALVLVFFKTTVLKAILSCALPLVITVLCESIIAKLAFIFFSFDVNSLANIPIYRLGISLMVQLSDFLFYLFIKYFKIQILMLENM